MEVLGLKRLQELIAGRKDGNGYERFDFFIPSFQRGYKWTRSEVFKLMYDIWDFCLHHNPNDTKSFYCLQPIVVRPVEERQIVDGVEHTHTVYHVIDGQQRLTTMLILQHASRDYQLVKWGASLSGKFQEIQSYAIRYATREDSSVWLQNLRDYDKMQNNSDYYHIHEAYRTALDFFKWIDGEDTSSSPFSKECPTDFRKANSCQTFDTCMKTKCCFIWYELDRTDDVGSDNEFGKDVEIFNDFNTGKIPLNNAELVKALLLQTRNFEQFTRENDKTVSQDYRINIAHEWDAIEHTLEDNKFWSFIYDPQWKLTYTTRIEYLLDILSGKTIKDKDNEFFTFDYFNDLYEKQSDHPKRFVDEQWRRVKDLLMMLQDWYDNKVYYHYVGFLLSQGKTVADIKKLQIDKDGNPVRKKDFINFLKDEIRQQTARYTVCDLYKGGNGVTPLLLLFNILLYLDSADNNLRFPFHHYKQSYIWNEEHVMPNTPFDPNDKRRSLLFAAQMLEYFTDISFFDECDRLRAELDKQNRKITSAMVRQLAVKNLTSRYEEKVEGMKTDSDSPYSHQKICHNLLEVFKGMGADIEMSQKCYQDLDELFNTSKNHLAEDEERNFLWNLVLLDEGTNKSYGNAIFPYKRKRIIKNDSKGIYVLKGTINVFMKAYSSQLENMFEWDKIDATNYLAEIIRRLHLTDGRRFLSKTIVDDDDVLSLPDFVNKEYLKSLLW